MLNPRTYETVGRPLGIAAQELTMQIGESLTDAHRRLINNPDLINQAGRQYDVSVNKALTEWNKKWKDWADEDLSAAYLRGINHTDKEIKHMGIKRSPGKEISEAVPLAGKDYGILPPKDIPSRLAGKFSRVPNHLTFYNVFRRAAYHSLEGSTLQVVRAADDLFRDVAVQAGSKMFRESDVFTRRQFSQTMLNDFANRGVQAVTYRDGRRVSIEAYSEMVGRTMSGHASVQAGLNRYEEYGYDLVRVSSHFRACPLCVPYEGRILSQSGTSSHYPGLDNAVAQGLFHPNCLHSVSPYFPGLSPKQEVRVDPAEQRLIDQHGYSKAQEIAYKAQQQQRYTERKIRDWKMRETTALDDSARNKAHRKVLDWQKAQREHLKKHPFLPRKYEREGVKGWAQQRAPQHKPHPFVQEYGVSQDNLYNVLGKEDADRFLSALNEEVDGLIINQQEYLGLSKDKQIELAARVESINKKLFTADEFNVYKRFNQEWIGSSISEGSVALSDSLTRLGISKGNTLTSVARQYGIGSRKIYDKNVVRFLDKMRTTQQTLDRVALKEYAKTQKMLDRMGVDGMSLVRGMRVHDPSKSFDIHNRAMSSWTVKQNQELAESFGNLLLEKNFAKEEIFSMFGSSFELTVTGQAEVIGISKEAITKVVPGPAGKAVLR